MDSTGLAHGRSKTRDFGMTNGQVPTGSGRTLALAGPARAASVKAL
jgi:hypothetical protein